MQDPVSEYEVDDILMSIRRLISNRATPVEQKPKPSGGRLLLTPELRISDDVLLQDREEKAEETKSVNNSPARTEKHPPVLEGAFEMATPEKKTMSERLSASASSFQTAADEGASPPEPPHFKEALAGDELPIEADQKPADFKQHSETIAVETEAEAEEKTQAEYSAQDQEAPATPFVEKTQADDPVDDQDDKLQTDFAAHLSARISAKIAALENVLEGTNAQWEPDGAEEDIFTNSNTPAFEWEDVEFPPHGSAEKSFAYEKDFEDSDTEEEDISEDDVIDETALREIVSTIVREELRGVLGERITRNVRKLVRREIQQAFTAQDLN